MEEIKLRKEIQEELKIEEARVKMRADLERKTREEEKKDAKLEVKVKVPKLEITKLKGNHLDWTRFWSQFEMEIDRSSLAPITKFSYLKEFLEPKARSMIDSLPFSSEGYNQAKSILVGKYGKPSEVANAHIRSVMALPTIHNTNPYKIYDFYECPIAHINTLDTMNKSKEINGYVRFTLDKLCDVRADLVRTDDNWQNWGFNELIGAIRKWTERNPIERLERSNRPFKEQHRTEYIMQTRQDTKTRECI